MALELNDVLMLERLRWETSMLQLELLLIKYERLLKANFNPNQPRVPRGNTDGGQWTRVGGGGSGTSTSLVGEGGTPSRQPQLVSSRPRSSGTVRIGGRLVEATPAQQARLAIFNARARDALRRVREVDPNRRPTASLHETIEGAITANENVLREAEARLAEFSLLPASQPSENLFRSGGHYIGMQQQRAGDEIRTITPTQRNELLAQLWRGAEPMATHPNYEGQWYRRPDGIVLALGGAGGTEPP
jgi:hypothetical protein